MANQLNRRDAFDLHFTERAEVDQDVQEERVLQNVKWGEQNHEFPMWMTILMEEVGEASQAFLKAHFGGKPASNIRDELVQVAAVAHAMIECGDRNAWWPKKASRRSRETRVRETDV